MCFARPPEISFAFLILVTFFSIKCDLMASTSIKQGNWCTCLDSEEARNISSSGKPHVHCSCFICKGKAVYPMTAWRHIQRANRAATETLDNQLPVPSTYSSEQSEVLDTCDVFQASDSFCEFPSNLPLASVGRHYERDENEFENESTASDHEILGASDGEISMSLSSDDNATCNSDDSSNGEEHNDPNRNEGGDEDLEQFVYDTVLRLVEIKGQAGFSQSIFEDLLQWGKDIVNKANINITWPSSWSDVLVLLEKFGYQSPRLYWICLDNSHPYLFGLLSAKDEFCPHCGQQGKIPYYYLSVIDKVKRWCSSPSMCQRMTAHWKEKSHWMPRVRQEEWGWEPKKEFWDGTRFAQLAYFWDPDTEWTLPVRCPVNGCGYVISAENLLICPVLNGDLRLVECTNCRNIFQHTPQKVKGDPRNLAYDGK